MAALRGLHRSVRLMLLGQNHTASQDRTDCPPLPTRCIHRVGLIRVCNLSQAALNPEPKINQNEEVEKTFVNRNPRNLEQMALAVKDRGWSTVWPKREYYHRLVFMRSQHHVSAAVFSRDSPVPVLTCSTQEWALKKQLSSTQSVAACRAVGDVLAQRCCEAGITRLIYREVPWTFRSEAVQTFWTAMKEGGVILNEPRRKFI